MIATQLHSFRAGEAEHCVSVVGQAAARPFAYGSPPVNAASLLYESGKIWLWCKSYAISRRTYRDFGPSAGSGSPFGSVKIGASAFWVHVFWRQERST